MRYSDSAAWYASLVDPRVVEHTSIPELTLASVEAMVARELDGYAAGTSCRWALADANDRLVGTCGFSNWSLPHSHAELVYDLAPAFWGGGLMRKAVHQVLAWALNNVGFNRVHAFVMTTNVPRFACSRRRASRGRALSAASASPEGWREISMSIPCFGHRPLDLWVRQRAAANPSLQRTPTAAAAAELQSFGVARTAGSEPGAKDETP